VSAKKADSREKRIDYIELPATDIAKAKAFLGNALLVWKSS